MIKPQLTRHAIKRPAIIASSIISIAVSLSACSQMGKVGSQKKPFDEDNALVIPPSLKMPSGVKGTRQQQRTVSTPKRIRTTKSIRTPRTQTTRSKANPNAKNYYVVVGTYPSQEEALDTFVRLSSIGLPNSTMETRMTKSGKRLHMVRLGPFQDQHKIDKVKDSLLSDGLSQFKVVEN